MATVSSRQSQFSSKTNFFNDLLDSNTNFSAHQRQTTNEQDFTPSIAKRPGTPKHTTFESALKRQNLVLTPEEKKRYSQLYNIDDENILQEIITKKNKHNSSLIGFDQNSIYSKTLGHSNQQSYNQHTGDNFENERVCTNTPNQHAAYQNHSQMNSLMSTPALQLKTPTSNIQTVTVLSPSTQLDKGKPVETDPTTKMNQYFQDFSKFHKEQEINHKKRMSGRLDIKQNQTMHEDDTRKPRFHLHSFINKLRSIPPSRVASDDSMTEKVYQTVNNIRAAQRHNIKPRYSLRYNKHYKLKNYSSISDLHIDLSDFAKSPTKNAPFTFHPKRRKTQRKNKTGTHTQTTKEELQKLWNEYLRQVVFQRVQLRLQMEKEYNTSSSFETNSRSGSGSGEEVRHSQDLTHLDLNRMSLFDTKSLRKYTSNLHAATHNEVLENEDPIHNELSLENEDTNHNNNHSKSSSYITNEDLYSIQNIINDYIDRKKKRYQIRD
ncbi:hypothetical protein ACO0QE_001139 [Hanseniaspora vineae]